MAAARQRRRRRLGRGLVLRFLPRGDRLVNLGNQLTAVRGFECGGRARNRVGGRVAKDCGGGEERMMNVRMGGACTD